MSYRIQFAPHAREQLDALEKHITAAGFPVTAANYVDAIVTFCASLASFPERGVSRDDLLPGLRVTHYRKRTIIAFRVTGDLVSVLGVYYGGQNYEAQLLDESGDH
jgi:toxin ParE1/3/4